MDRQTERESWTNSLHLLHRFSVYKQADRQTDRNRIGTAFVPKLQKHHDGTAAVQRDRTRRKHRGCVCQAGSRTPATKEVKTMATDRTLYAVWSGGSKC